MLVQLPKFLLDFAKQKLAKSRGKFPRFHVLISKADFCIGFCVSFFCFYYYALIAHNENCWQQPTNQKVKSCYAKHGDFKSSDGEHRRTNTTQNQCTDFNGR